MKKLLLGILLMLVLTSLYFLFYPVDFDPVAYSPPENPGFEGVFAPNQKLDQLQFILNETGMAPEDIALGPDSALYTGFDDGRIVKFSLEGELIATLGNTIGRPLGMKFDPAGKLIIADEYKGLISMDELGEVRVLTNEVAGTPIHFADDLDISSEGIIYFTDASQRNHADEIEKEFWELQPTGRLLSYHPESQETRLELSGLRFANGVAIGPEEEYLLINETVGMQIMKYWLKGPKQGQAEVFFDQLPAYPDNINFDGDSLFWVGLSQARNPAFEELYEKPFTRKVIARLPKFLTETEEVAPMGLVLAINLKGEVIHFLQSPTGKIHDVTSVLPIGNQLYLGNLEHTAIGKLPIPQ
ncbi:MAG: SMP-30/gluconolactonase/LRE family protein [Bacteroidia bacterium]|nr:SMP-30/gluconolactonase/LRE family protein [Bacteroidia bacterium]